MPTFDTDAAIRRLRAAGCVFAEEEAQLMVSTAASTVELEALLTQRVAGAPLEYVLGWVEFKGVRIDIRPGVFVPRQRSALLVDEAVALAGARRTGTVVDLCCGSGALGRVLLTELRARRLPLPQLFAADIDPVAVDCARHNLASVGGRVHRGDLFDALPHELRGSIDIIVANTPYVPSAALGRLPPEARDHEPPTALDGGRDGLDLARRTAAAAPAWLVPGGSLLIEIGIDQAPATMALLTDSGLHPRIAHSADIGATVAIGTAPAATSDR